MSEVPLFMVAMDFRTSVSFLSKREMCERNRDYIRTTSLLSFRT